VKVKSVSRVRVSATPWTAAHQAPPSIGSSRQEYWSGVPLPSPNYQLNNLFNTLKGDPDLNSPCSHSQEAGEELYLVQNKLQKQFLTLTKLDLPLELFILPSLHSPTGLLAQKEHPVEWIYTCFRGIKFPIEDVIEFRSALVKDECGQYIVIDF